MTKTKRFATLILALIMMSLCVVNVAAKVVVCKEYTLSCYNCEDENGKLKIGATFQVTPTLTTDSYSSSGYRVSGLAMSFKLTPNGFKYPHTSQIGVMYHVKVIYELPGGWTTAREYTTWQYLGNLANEKPFTSPTSSITIPAPTDVSEYKGTKSIHVEAWLYYNCSTSGYPSGTFYDLVLPEDDLYMSNLVSQNT